MDADRLGPSGDAYLRGKTLLITGASRGIGRAIALRAAIDGANVAIVAKTTETTLKLPGTIYTVAKEVQDLGGAALPLKCDIRSEEQVKHAIDETVRAFGGIDIIVNNASAIHMSSTESISLKSYNLMQDINVRGTFIVSKCAIPHLRRSTNGHILMMSPPVDLRPEWFRKHTAYTMAKYGMSMAAYGLAQELADSGIAVNCLWPRTIIYTAALQAFAADQLEQLMKTTRKPEIVADAAYAIVCQQSKDFTGQFLIDEQVLRAQGITTLDHYAYTPGSQKLTIDLFVDEKEILGEIKPMKRVLRPQPKPKL